MSSLATTCGLLQAPASVPSASPTSQVKMWLWCLRGPCAPLVLPCEIVAQHRRVGGHRLVRIDERRQRLVLDLDEIDRVGGDVAVLGHDEGDLLALEQHLLVGQYRLHVAGQCRHAMQLERLQIGGGQHRLDARQLERCLLVDRFDAGVAIGRADEIAEQHAGQFEIVDIIALALGEADVLDALAPGAEAFELLCARLGRFRSRRSFCGLLGAAHALGGGADRLDDVLIAGAAAEIAGNARGGFPPRSGSGFPAAADRRG